MRSSTCCFQQSNLLRAKGHFGEAYFWCQKALMARDGERMRNKRIVRMIKHADRSKFRKLEKTMRRLGLAA